MSRQIQVVGLDPSFSNFGIAKATIDCASLKVTITGLALIETEPDKHKQMVKSSDDLRRAKIVYQGMKEHVQGATIAFAELPFFHAQMYASAVHNTGMSIGLLGACPVPIIGVQPTDVKLAAVGARQAAKEEMIQWATALHPEAPWLKGKVRGQLKVIAKNEHLADAVGAIYAGMNTEQFKQVLNVLRAAA